MKNKISACLVVYNEEKNIRKCLESIRDVVDEIIVVHDGKCGDRTLEICQEFNTKIFSKSHEGFMEAHIPFCFEEASGNWIFRIDADEYLSNELKNNLRKLIQDEYTDAYEFLWPIWDGKKYITKEYPYKLCLFRKNKITFLGIIHFTPIIMGSTKRVQLTLEHHPSNIFKDKFLHRAKIQAIYYLKDFKNIKKFNYNKKDWNFKTKLRIKIPLLCALPDFILSFISCLINSGAINYYNIKISFWSGVYKFMVDLYIFYFKMRKLVF